MTDNDILDETWIHELQRIHNVKHNYCKENMKSIYIHSIFINNEKQVDKIINSQITLSQYKHSENITMYPKIPFYSLLKTVLNLIRVNHIINLTILLLSLLR